LVSVSVSVPASPSLLPPPPPLLQSLSMLGWIQCRGMRAGVEASLVGNANAGSDAFWHA
jgi:hypothetical protein